MNALHMSVWLLFLRSVNVSWKLLELKMQETYGPAVLRRDNSMSASGLGFSPGPALLPFAFFQIEALPWTHNQASHSNVQLSQ